MRRMKRQIVAMTGAMTMLLMLAGCGTKSDLAQRKNQKPSTMQAGLEDSRIPLARRAEIERIMAQ